MGILEEGAAGPGGAFDFNDPAQAAVLSKLFLAQPESIKLPDAAAAAAATRDVKGLDAAARATAGQIVGDYAAAVARGTAPASAFHAVFRAHAEPSKERLVADLRYINEFVPDHPFRMATWDDFLGHYEKGRMYAKTDASKFFYHIPLDPSVRKYFGVVFGNRVLRYTRLPMGFKLSPAVACALSGTLCTITRAQGFKDVNAFVDDFITGGVEHGHQSCEKALEATLANCAKAGVMMSMAKTVAPTRRLTIVGGEVDTVNETLAMPGSRAFSAMVKAHVLRLLVARDDGSSSAAMAGEADSGGGAAGTAVRPATALLRGVSEHYVQQVAGILNWWASLAFGAAAHLGGLYKASYSGLTLLDVASGVSNDLEWWAERWASGSLIPLRLMTALRPVVSLEMGGTGEAHATVPVAVGHDVAMVTADASGPIGGGAIQLPPASVAGTAVAGGRALHLAWTPQERDCATTPWKEARVVVEAARRWGHTWRNKVVVILTDNKGNAFNFNTGRGGTKQSRALVQELYSLAEAHGFEFVAVWIERQSNTAADALSNCPDRASAARVCSDRHLVLQDAAQ
jgi:hypothetical protein